MVLILIKHRECWRKRTRVSLSTYPCFIVPRLVTLLLRDAAFVAAALAVSLELSYA